MATTISEKDIIYQVIIETQKSNRNLAKIDKTVKKVDQRLDSFKNTAQNVGKILAAAFVTTQLVSFTRELRKTALEMEAFRRRAEVVFGKSIGIINEFAKENAKALGLTVNQFKGAAAAIGDLVVPLGLSRKRAAEMSVQLVKLGGALKQFTGDQRSAAEISSVVARALTGEVEGLKQLGVTVSLQSKEFQDLVKQKMRDEGVTLLQAKALAIYETAIQRSTDALSSLENDTDSLTRQTAELDALWQQEIETLTALLTPAILATTKALKGLFEVEIKPLFTKAQVNSLDNFAKNLEGLDIFQLNEQFNVTTDAAEEQREKLNALTQEWQDLKDSTVSLFKGGKLRDIEEQFEDEAGTLEFLNGRINRVSDALGILEDKTAATNQPLETVKLTVQGLTEEIKKLNDELLDQSLNGNINIATLTQLAQKTRQLAEANETLAKAFQSVQFALENASEAPQPFITAGAQIVETQEAAQTEILETGEIFRGTAALTVKDADQIRQQSVAALDATLMGINTVGVAFSDLFLQGSDLAKEFALVSIVADTARAIAGAVAAAQSIPFPGNIAAIAVGIASVLANIATAKQILGQADTAQFAEGEIDIHRSGEKRGKDSITAMLTPGESVITARDTKENKPLLKALHSGNLEDFIQEAYISPALMNLLRSDSLDRAGGSTMAYNDYQMRLAIAKNKTINLSGDTIRLLASQMRVKTRVH